MDGKVSREGVARSEGETTCISRVAEDLGAANRRGRDAGSTASRSVPVCDSPCPSVSSTTGKGFIHV